MQDFKGLPQEIMPAKKIQGKRKRIHNLYLYLEELDGVGIEESSLKFLKAHIIPLTLLVFPTSLLCYACRSFKNAFR